MTISRSRLLGILAKAWAPSRHLLIGLTALVSVACDGRNGPGDDGDIVEPSRPLGNDHGSRVPAGIQPGEKLDVFVMEDDSFSGTYMVRSQGDIIVPKVGRVKVSGMSVASAEKSLKRALERDQLTVATVILDRTDLLKRKDLNPERGTEIFLSGKVMRPGRYTVTGIAGAQPTVHQAILQAGGCSRFAYKKKAHILRRGSDGRLRRIEADLLAIESGEAPDVPLLTGDIVRVPEKKVDFGL